MGQKSLSKFFALLVLLALMPGTSNVKADTPPAAPPVYATLATTRASITPQPYTADERLVVAGQADLIIKNMYVHRKLKEEVFHVNPLPTLTEVLADAATLPDATFHQRLEKTFLDERDAHTNYYYPKSQACYASFLPFLGGEATPTGSSGIELAITKISTNPAVVALAPMINQLAIGDVLVSYNGLDPLVQARKLAEMGDGSTQSGRKRWAYNALFYRYHIMQPLPDQNTVQLKFKKPTGEVYSIEIPWLTQANLSCLGFSPAAALPGGNAAHKPKYMADQGDNDYQIQFEQIFKPHSRHYVQRPSNQRQNPVPVENPNSDLSSPIQTVEPIVNYKVIQNEHGTFGYLRLDSFEPSVLSTDDTILLIRSLLNNELAKTDGLFIDLRDNGGGEISFGEDMIQLFFPGDVETEGFRMLATPENQFFLQTSNFSSLFLGAVNAAIQAGAEMTVPEKLTSLSSANNLGQSYFKPVSILTNSGCFSTCDMFTAGMQDHGAALIWAEDGNTGGGGANVVNQSFFYGELPANNKGSFQPLPGGQDMRIAWRQTVRVKLHEGQLIEDVGVIADKVIPASTEDVVQFDQPQVDRITAEMVSRKGNYEGSIYLDESHSYDVTSGQNLEIPVTVTATNAVQFMINGKVVAQQSLLVGTAPQNAILEVAEGALSPYGNIGNLEIVGLNASQQRAWRKVITYRITPVPVAPPVSIDLSGSSLSPLTVYTLGVDPSQGWQIQNGVIRVGKGPNYLDDTTTQMSAFLDLTGHNSTKVNFTMELHSESGYDFFQVIVVSNGVEKTVIAPMSGDVAAQNYSIDLSAYAGQKIEVRFQFDSDPGVNFAGPLISNLQIQ